MQRLHLTVLVFIASLATLQAAEPLRLRVLSYNIHHAEGVDRQLDVERIARVILSVKPDLVALMERRIELFAVRNRIGRHGNMPDSWCAE